MAQIRTAGSEAGVAVNPATPVALLEEILPAVDFVLLMSVNPGFAGQRFLPRSLAKARQLGAILAARGLQAEVEMDGGIDLGNIREVAMSGVDTVVAGSAVFATDDPVAALRRLRSEIEETPR